MIGGYGAVFGRTTVRERSSSEHQSLVRARRNGRMTPWTSPTSQKNELFRCSNPPLTHSAFRVVRARSAAGIWSVLLSGRQHLLTALCYTRCTTQGIFLRSSSPRLRRSAQEGRATRLLCAPRSADTGRVFYNHSCSRGLSWDHTLTQCDCSTYIARH